MVKIEARYLGEKLVPTDQLTSRWHNWEDHKWFFITVKTWNFVLFIHVKADVDQSEHAFNFQRNVCLIYGY
jgi:hypothetical protein